MKEIVSTVGEPLEVDEVSLVRVDPIRVKVLSWDFSNINCYVEVFINSVGYEIKFEVEGGVAGKKGAPVCDHFNKSHVRRKDDDDEEDEEESNGSNHKIKWEKLAEKFGGDTHQSFEQKSGGGSAKTKARKFVEVESEEGNFSGEIRVDHQQSPPSDQALAIVPLAFSYPTELDQGTSGQ